MARSRAPSKLQASGVTSKRRKRSRIKILRTRYGTLSSSRQARLHPIARPVASSLTRSISFALLDYVQVRMHGSCFHHVH